LARAGGRVMARIKKGDLVVVRSGADRGKRGKVLRVLPGDGKAVVEGVRLVYKHLKKGRKEMPQGGRIQREAAVPLSSLMPRDRRKATNDRALPRVQKITLSMGVGDAVENKKLVDSAAASLTQIAGQRAVVTDAKRSVASWHVRQGMPIGAKVTMRGRRAYE